MESPLIVNIAALSESGSILVHVITCGLSAPVSLSPLPLSLWVGVRVCVCLCVCVCTRE